MRQTVNTRMSRSVWGRGGVVVRHRQLRGYNGCLMSSDGIHLNETRHLLDQFAGRGKTDAFSTLWRLERSLGVHMLLMAVVLK